ncbi:MAG TPA: AAA family ATPase [Thiotrichales bacterium]|nr:AAA family ATPase [Thiotrichales bacterium]
MQELDDLELLWPRTPIFVIESLEEPRVVELFTRLGLRLQQPVFRWTVTDGLVRVDVEMGGEGQYRTEEPTAALRHIRSLGRGGCFLLLDFHPFLQDPVNVRLIKEIAQRHESVPATLVLVSHTLDVPPEIRHLVARFDLRLPDRSALLEMIREEAVAWQKRNRRKLRVEREAMDAVANALAGVSVSDARRLIREAIERDGALTTEDLPEVMQARHALLDGSGVVRFEYDTAQYGDVAGLHNLKRWLDQRRPFFRGEATELDRPRGVLLLGVQGCGKSLAARAVAGRLGLALLRLDFGTLYDKYIGETERNLREALETAAAVAPCVLWIDELEKGLALSDADDGVSRRVLGTFLTWLSENRKPVFLVATANDVSRLPPELLRKGRFDEIFFVDLPDAATRAEIFAIHLRRRGLSPVRFDLKGLAEASEGFAGAGIEQAVVSALYAARARGTELDDRMIREELGRTRPLSVVMGERIERLRAWGRERTVRA